ncbi:MAG: c-type cytochrome [Betaproteobacteria bacterium]
MTSSSKWLVLGAAVAVAVGVAAVRAQAPAPQLQLGKKVFEDTCAKCHGRSGKGDGPDSIKLGFHPRDFTLGAFKCRCTPTGQPPTDADLLRTVTNGMPGTPMIANKTLTDEQRAAVVQYIKTLSKVFETASVADCAPPPPPPAASAEMVAEGKQLYEKMQCAKCHGTGGRGDGPSAGSLVDDWGRPIKPYNFVVLKNFKCGNDDRDLFRTLTTGMTGSPMPSFADALAFDTAGMADPQKHDLVAHRVWALVQYLRSLQK